MKNIILYLLAASFAVPEMPEAEWDDTEVVTNEDEKMAARQSPRTSRCCAANVPEQETRKIIC